MNPQSQELNLEESIRQVVHTLPLPIREYLGQGGHSIVAKNLMTKYGLRVDQGDILEREITLLLMGIENPDEFTQALVEEAKLDQHAVNGITHDVNEQIFIPLREQMQKGWENIEQSVMPAPPPALVTPQSRAAAPLASYVPPRPVAPRASDLPQPTVIIPANPSMPMRPQQQEYITKVPKYAPPHPPVSAMPPRPPVPAQRPIPPMNTGRMLEAHEEPHMEFRQSVSRITPPPSDLPGMPLPRPVSPELPPPVPLSPKPPRPPMQSYSSDPYREPFDGEGS